MASFEETHRKGYHILYMLDLERGQGFTPTTESQLNYMPLRDDCLLPLWMSHCPWLASF